MSNCVVRIKYYRLNLEECFLDNLPDLAEEYHFYVCNTDPSSEPGDDGVVLHTTRKTGEYLDSLDKIINNDEFSQFLCGEYRYVSVQTLELFSGVCG